MSVGEVERYKTTVEITGLGETYPLNLTPELDFVTHDYLDVIDDQLKWIANDAATYQVDMEPEKFGARSAEISARPVGDPGHPTHGLSKSLEIKRHKVGFIARATLRVRTEFVRVKSEIYRTLQTPSVWLTRQVRHFTGRGVRGSSQSHPVLIKSLQNTHLVLSESTFWLARNSTILELTPTVVMHRGSPERISTSMRLIQEQMRALCQHALRECEVNPLGQSRLFVVEHDDQSAATLAALYGNLFDDDKILMLGDPSSRLPNWGEVTEVAPSQWLYTGVPSAARKSHIPAPPPGGWPKISVVTVSLNQADYIAESLDSILDQNYPNLEFIVIDGGSTDGTVEILNRYRERITKLVIEPDKGQSDALNKGFRMATGDVMTWLCSDDLLAMNSLFHIGHTFATNQVDIVCGGCRVINASGNLQSLHHSSIPLNAIQQLSFGDLLNFMGNWQAGHYFFQPEVFFSREIWRRSGGYLREHLYYAMDYDLFLRMAMAGATILHVSRTIASSRQHSNQKTQHGSMAYLAQIHGIIGDYQTIIQTVRQACH